MGMKALLVLEDGTCFEGISIGAPGERIGGVILNTGVVGYQEIMTDPANAGKIVVLTYPLIGNYGVAKKFNESKKCWIGSLVIKENSRMPSNWQTEDSLDDFLKNQGVLAISGIDTRTLAVNIRDKGERPGIVSTKRVKKADLVKRLKDKSKKPGRDFIKGISVRKIANIKGKPGAPKIGIIDLGIMNNFLRQLKSLGCSIMLLPYNTPSEKILALKLDGLVISSGPEDDEAIPGVLKVVQGLLGKIPVFGISLGHEIIGLALGGKRLKMKVGHHGVNYPVKSPSSYRGEITVQNHSFALDPDSIKDKKEIEITLRNVNDDSIEEMESKRLKFISTQYYPASPGLNEVHDVFKRFLKMTRKKKAR